LPARAKQSFPKTAKVAIGGVCWTMSELFLSKILWIFLKKLGFSPTNLTKDDFLVLNNCRVSLLGELKFNTWTDTSRKAGD